MEQGNDLIRGCHALELAALGDPRVNEVRRDVDVLIDTVAAFSARVGVLERTLGAVHQFAAGLREAISARSAEAAHDAAFDLQGATARQLDDLLRKKA